MAKKGRQPHPLRTFIRSAIAEGITPPSGVRGTNNYKQPSAGWRALNGLAAEYSRIRSLDKSERETEYETLSRTRLKGASEATLRSIVMEVSQQGYPEWLPRFGFSGSSSEGTELDLDFDSFDDDDSFETEPPAGE